MNNSITAHIKLIHRQNVFGVIIVDFIVCAEFSFCGLFGSEHIANLNIDPFAVLVTNKIDLSISVFTDIYLISAAQKFHANNIFENQFDIAHIASEKCLPESVIGEIVLFINFENFLPAQIHTVDLIEQKRFLAGGKIVNDRIHRYRPPLVL